MYLMNTFIAVLLIAGLGLPVFWYWILAGIFLVSVTINLLG